MTLPAEARRERDELAASRASSLTPMGRGRSRRPRVLHLIPTLGAGGAERQLTYIAPPLVSEGWTVDVGAFDFGPFAGSIRGTGVQLHRIRQAGRFDPTTVVRIASLIARLKPDLVHTWLRPMDVLGGAACLALGQRWLASERSAPQALQGEWKSIPRRLMLPRATALVANSHSGADYWSGVQGDVRVIPNAVPLPLIDRVTPVEAIVDVPEGTPVVMAAGRLDEHKNLENLIEAVSRLERPAMLLICGSGPGERELRRHVARLRCGERVRLLNTVHDIWRLMKRASLFASVSWFEGRSNVALEAAACGCPLLLSDIRAHHEIADERSALFANPSSPSSIRAAIERHLNDPAAAHRRASVARERLEQWNISSIVGQYLDLYRSVLRQDGAGLEPVVSLAR